jgi:hypothetical protein
LKIIKRAFGRVFVLEAMTNPLVLSRVSDQLWQVLLQQGGHVGNLKLIGGAWKFKAIGYDASGSVMPGHGPLTQHHNARFEQLDEALICTALTLD